MASFQNPASSFAQGEVSPLVVTGSLLGILVHVSLVKIELEQFMYSFIASYAISFVFCVYLFTNSGGLSILNALTSSLILFTCFNASIFTSIVVYRAFLHRCRTFPGPFPARLSKFYAAYLFGRDFRYYQDLARMHEQYGDYVRTGPREISIMDKAAVPLLYGPESECTKSTWYTQQKADSAQTSINQTRDKNVYRRRRRVWDRGLSVKALGLYQPRIKALADLLVEKMHDRVGTPIDATTWGRLFSFDVMGQVGFSADFGNMVNGEKNHALAAIGEHFDVLGILQEVPWLMNILSNIPGAQNAIKAFIEMTGGAMNEKLNDAESLKDPKDIASWIAKSIADKDVGAPPTMQAFADDGRTLFIAGSDTTATVFSNAIYYLAKDRARQRKLQAILDATFPEGYSTWNWEKVKEITYIDDIVNETLRMKPPVLHGGPRETPAHGLKIGEVYIPGYVNVVIPYMLIQLDPRYYSQPLEWIPERYGEKKEEMGTDGQPFLSFGLGMHTCPGRNLGFMNLRTSLSALFLNFDVEFAEGETGEEFDDVVDKFLMDPNPLMVKFVSRNKK